MGFRDTIEIMSSIKKGPKKIIEKEPDNDKNFFSISSC